MVIEQTESGIFSPLNNSTIVVKDPSLSHIYLGLPENEHKENKDFIITELSHDEVDLQIQFNRVMYVLRRAIEKMKIVAYIPTFIENDGDLLKTYFEDDIVQFILDICEKDPTLSDNIGQRSFHLRKKENSPPVLKNTKMDQAMLELIAVLYNCKEIKKDIIENDNIVYCEDIRKLIVAMDLLYEACQHKLQMTAAEEKSRQQQLRKAWRTNIIVQKDIKTLQKKLTDQRERFSKEMYIKKKLIEEYEEKIEAVTEKFEEKMNKRVAESEKLMGLEAAASEIKIAELTIEAKQVQIEYQALLENHIAYEKGLRAKRLKVETQLATWLAKYDQDIGERYYEIEKLTAAYEKEKAEMDALQELFDEQEEEYEELMEEKADEDRRLYEIRMYKILANISARKIQRAWRGYWARKLARIKARKARAKEKKLGLAQGGGKGKKRGKKNKTDVDNKIKVGRDSDMLGDLSKMVKGDLLDDLITPAFDTRPINVEL